MAGIAMEYCLGLTCGPRTTPAAERGGALRAGAQCLRAISSLDYVQRRIMGIKTAFGLTCTSHRQPRVRVVDAAAMPQLPSVIPNITVMTMVETRADLIRKS